MKLYRNKDFWFVEKTDGRWYELPYESEDDDWEEIPVIKHPEHHGMIQEKINMIEYPSWLTDCDICSNNGYVIGFDEDDTFVCECWHGQTHGERSLVSFREIL